MYVVLSKAENHVPYGEQLVHKMYNVIAEGSHKPRSS